MKYQATKVIQVEMEFKNKAEDSLIEMVERHMRLGLQVNLHSNYKDH